MENSAFCSPYFDSEGNEALGAITSFTFEAALGDLPPIVSDTTLLMDTSISDGEFIEGSGFISTFAGGASGSVIIELDTAETATLDFRCYDPDS